MVVAQVSAALSATTIFRRAAAQKQVVARVSAALSETQTSKQPVARVLKKEAAHRVVLPVNVDLFKTRTDRPIAAPRLEVVLDNAVLFEITTCKPCVAPRLAAAPVSAASFATLI